MNEQLRLLIELQKLDTSILAARMEIDEIPGRVSAGEGPLKKAEAASEQAKQGHAALEQKKRDKDRDIEDLNEKIKKLKQRTADIKTNKEYQAHLKEIERAEKDLKAAEDDSLSLMDAIEQSSKRLAAESASLAGEKAKVDELKRQLDEEAQRQEASLKKLKGERKKYIDALDSDLYALYMSIMKASRGLAVVEAKNEVCQGCNLHIPPQFFVELKRNDEITQCPQCRRILYYPGNGDTPQEPQPEHHAPAADTGSE
ncbi:MAG: C4-type zinc ribbon domain-containing protein [Nitrospirota bacterium]